MKLTQLTEEKLDKIVTFDLPKNIGIWVKPLNKFHPSAVPPPSWDMNGVIPPLSLGLGRTLMACTYSCSFY